MEQSASTSHDATPLSPTEYPILIKIFGVLVVALVLTSVVTIPPYVIAGRQLFQAGKLSYKENFESATDLYLEVLKKFPGCFSARVGAAESLFSQHNHAADLQALQLLEGARIDEMDWKKLEKVMPKEYQDQFKPVANQSTRSKSTSNSPETSKQQEGNK